VSSISIAEYAGKLDAQRAAICTALQRSITAALPNASSKLWHAIPVWFVGTNPVVGYTARKAGVMLMFWNGQHFEEPELQASGSFHMAQIAYNDASEIDEVKLARWLKKAAKAKTQAKPKAAKSKVAKSPKRAKKKKRVKK
jgi:hypothetical protein